MNTTAVRLYGKSDIRLETFPLPPVGPGEILARVVSDSLCMSSHKAALQGASHKRVPDDVAQNPVILGHEFCGEIVEVGARWQGAFQPGQRFAIQPALNDPDDPHAAPGYSFPYIGGGATYIVIPEIVMTRGCLLPYDGDAFFYGSLAEPVSCIVGAFHTSYHTRPASHEHIPGIVPGGRMAVLAGAGPMGLGAIDYALHSDVRPVLLVVTDVDDARLTRAAAIYSPAEAARFGVTLLYVNTASVPEPATHLRGLAGGGYDDVFVYAPVGALCQQADALLAYDGCLNFFAGPTDPAFSAPFNFYNVHYMNTHVAGNSGGTIEDMKEALALMASGRVRPASMVTHIGGLDCVPETTLALPKIPGGKKLIYTQISLPLTALADLPALGATDPLCAALADILAEHNGLWCLEAERCLLGAATAIDN
ncbi:MAG: zinc-binding dehydrogenase [Oscillospiraceae bacterium]|jgi:threonine dehydrogenase-like Zn-dependent dehydrogenase|nr:zinc-binding dehydrogenase [Oscillospiraceae bacterium]